MPVNKSLRTCTWAASLLFALSRYSTALDSCAASTSPRKVKCQYGTLPGRWLKGDLGDGWNVYNPECQLQNYLGSPSGPEEFLETLGDEAGILLFGDSVDRYMVNDICNNEEMGKQWDEPHNSPSEALDSFCICR